MFDIVNKRCETNGCMKSPKFNFEGQTACRFCESHKLNGMVDRSEQHQTGESDEVIKNLNKFLQSARDQPSLCHHHSMLLPVSP
jgi:hypothetical protein